MRKVWKIFPFFLLVYWGGVLLTKQPLPWIFLDNVNLIFHEAGHVIFWPFGNFMHILGGSLLQCLIPFGIGLYFLYSKQFYAAVFCLFWLGDNIINVSYYIKDSTDRILPLLGDDPSGHDWHNLLEMFSILRYDQQIAGFVWSIGLLCLAVSLSTYIYLLLRDFFSSNNLQ